MIKGCLLVSYLVCSYLKVISVIMFRLRLSRRSCTAGGEDVSRDTGRSNKIHKYQSWVERKKTQKRAERERRGEVLQSINSRSIELQGRVQIGNTETNLLLRAASVVY